MKRTYQIIIILLLLISLFIPGHVRQYFGWLTGYITYALVFVLVGYLYYKSRKHTLVYTMIGAALFLYLPVSTWFDYSDFWYPFLSPMFMLAGALGFILGYFAAAKRVAPVIITLIALIVVNTYLSQRINYHVYRTFIDPPSYNTLISAPVQWDTLSDINSATLPKEMFRNKVVVMDFWFVECTSCRIKMKVFDSLYAHYKERDDIIFLSVADGAINTLEEVNTFLDKRKIQCPVAYDVNGQMCKKNRLGVNGYPVELRIGKDGLIHKVIVGAPDAAMYFQESVQHIDELLKQDVR